MNKRGYHPQIAALPHEDQDAQTVPLGLLRWSKNVAVDFAVVSFCRFENQQNAKISGVFSTVNGVL